MAQALNLMFGPEVQTAESDFPIRSYFDNAVTIADIKLVAFGLCGLLALAVVLFMKNSRMGQAIRATAQDARAARVMGIDTERTFNNVAGRPVPVLSEGKPISELIG